MAVSSVFLTICLTPVVLICGLFLLPFAIFTTTVAISTLTIRVLVVYIELFVAIITNHFSTLKSHTPSLSVAPAKRPESVRSFSTTSSGSQTPRPSIGLPVYPANSSLTRDFEGVGGWRFAVEDTEAEEEWVTMNARLELPAVGAIPAERKRKHQRSLTQGAVSMDKLRRRTNSNRPKPAAMPGRASPEETLKPEGRAKSAIALGDVGMNVGKSRGLGRRKSESSDSSGATLTIQGSTDK